MKKLLSKKVLLIAVPLLLIAGLAGAAVVLLPRMAGGPLQIKISTGGATPTESAAGHEPAKDDHGRPASSSGSSGGKEKVEQPVISYTTRERIVNLADKGGFRYLKVEVVLDVVVPHSKPGDKLPKGEAMKELTKEVEAEMSGVKARLEDAINSTLTSKTAEELMTAEGKQRLRDELRAKLDRLSETPVVAVYFTQFIIQ
jgi:flagellar FliL protein